MLALVQREYLERRTFRLGLLLDVVFGVLNLVVYFYISQVLRHPSRAQLHGAHSFFAFVAVGLAYMLVIQAASAGLTRRVREEELTGTLEALSCQPLSSHAMAFGMAGFQYSFALVRAAVYLAIAGVWLGLGLSHVNWLGAVLIVTMSGPPLVAIGITMAAIVVAVGQGWQIVTVAVFALGFLGGAYFPISLLPRSIQTISYLSPARYALDGLRAALYGGSWTGDLALLVGISLVIVPLSLLGFDRALLASRRRGTLTRA